MNDNLSRRVPVSIEAEQSVLGAILIKPECMDKLVGMISSGDFYLTEHQQIFSAMQQMYLKSRNIDVITLLDELVKDGVYDEAGGKEYIALISETVPTAANVTDYAKIVRDKSILRTLIDACETTAEEAYAEERDAKQLLEVAEQRIYSIADESVNRDFVHIRDALMLSFNRLKELETNRAEALGMQTGFSGIDRVLVGMGKGDLIIVGARPGMGKTSFALNIAEHVATKEGKAVAMFSLEMSREQLGLRLLCSTSGVNSQSARTGDLSEQDFYAIADAMGPLSAAPIYIDDTAVIGPTEIIAKVKRLQRTISQEIGLVIIDYLQLMQGSSTFRNENRQQEISNITRNLKVAAKEIGVPIMLLSQLSRATEKRENKRPMLSDLRESGAIEQDADVVLFLHREDYYQENVSGEQSRSQIIIAKQRPGPTGTIDVTWRGDQTKYTETDFREGE